MKVSIIIPVYNAKDTIVKCIKSIQIQTHKEIEIIAINDGSKDDSLGILKEMARKDKRIVVVDKENEGVAKTRNLGIKKATGDYIMFVDNDDFVEKDYVEKYLKEADDNDIVIGGYKRVDENNKILLKKKIKNTEWSKYNIIVPWAKLYKRDFIVNNKLEFLNYKIGEDVYFNIVAYSNTNKIKIIDNIDYIWFYNTKSISNTIHKGLKKDVDYIYLLNKLLKKIDKKNKYMCYYLERSIVWYLLYSGRNSNKKDFVVEFKKLYSWKKEKSIKSKITPFSFKLRGEGFKNRMAVFLFRIINKINLVKLFARIYCKGDDCNE